MYNIDIVNMDTIDIDMDIDNMHNNSCDAMKNLQNKTELLLINGGWNDKNESLLISIGKDCLEYKRLHYQSYMRFNLYNKIINFSLIILSSALSVQTLVDNPSTATPGVNAFIIIRRIIIYIVAVLSLLQQFMKYEEQSIKHQSHSKMYSQLYHTIQQTLCFPRKDRGLATVILSQLYRRFDNLLTGPFVNYINLYNDKDDNKFKDNLNTNSEFKITGDISDAEISKLSTNDIKALNNYYLDKRNIYEYNRFLECDI